MGKGIRIKDVSKINWKEVVRYDEDSPTGLVWINPPSGVKSGRKQAGGLCTNGGEPHMARIRYKGEAYPIHRIIWFMFHGSIDNDLVIDHLDGNPWNNKFDNLFIKTLGDNARNARMYSSNTSGIAGVSIMDNGSGNKYAMATWRDENLKPRSKYFSFDKLGEEQAIQLAAEFRKQKIQELINIGFQYTERHGQ